MNNHSKSQVMTKSFCSQQRISTKEGDVKQKMCESSYGIQEVISEETIIDDFERALNFVKKSSLDTQTVKALCDLLSNAKEAIKENDKTQEKSAKDKFEWWKEFVLGKEAKKVLSILKDCTAVLTYFGLKP